MMLFRCKVREVIHREVYYWVDAFTTKGAADLALLGVTAREGETLDECVYERQLVGFPVPDENGAPPHNSVGDEAAKD